MLTNDIVSFEQLGPDKTMLQNITLQSLYNSHPWELTKQLL